MELWDVMDVDRNRVGRTHERGQPMRDGDYHLVVHVWIQNSAGEYLISKRTPNKLYPNLWECTGGSAVAGDTSLMAALREVKEELGIDLDPLGGALILRETRSPDHADIWLFRQEAELRDVVFQEGETCDAKWATKDDIREMLKTGEFVPVFDYLEWLFEFNAPIAFFPSEMPERIQFAVIACLKDGEWLHVRHSERDTWELPGGHVDPGETPLEAARRELYEESGATDFDIWPVCPYSVARGNIATHGMLYFAHVRRFDALPGFETAERAFMRLPPERMTYPDIQPKLIARADAWLKKREMTDG